MRKYFHIYGISVISTRRWETDVGAIWGRGVLIPRPETEHLVVAAIDLARAVDRGAEICDVGTGSGIIAAP